MQTRTQYKGLIDCAVQIAKLEGFTAFYRGLLSPVVGKQCSDVYSAS
jgi:hypothetical protein